MKVPEYRVDDVGHVFFVVVVVMVDDVVKRGEDVPVVLPLDDDLSQTLKLSAREQMEVAHQGRQDVVVEVRHVMVVFVVYLVEDRIEH